MSAGMRDYLIRWSVAQSGPIHQRLTCLWFINASAEIRLIAAQAAATLAATGALAPALVEKAVMLRSWMPEDKARRHIDQMIRDSLRAGGTGNGPRTAPETWSLHGMQASLPDGGGAQSIAMALRSGKSRKVAMLLLKQGYGVKDAFILPCGSASEQRELMRRHSDDTDAQNVSIGWLESALALALSDGLAAGVPPAPGLIEIAELCGLSALRPEAWTLASTIAALPEAAQISALSAQARGKLITASEEWYEHHPMIKSWFDDSDAAYEMISQSRGARAVQADLWTHLETKRDWWATLIARAASVLSATGHGDAASFTATAMALMGGRELKKIPVMLDVHAQSIAAWMSDDPDLAVPDFDGPGPDNTLSPTNLDDFSRKPPAAERRGELARMLKRASLSSDWLEGFLLGLVIAPKPIAPDRWLPEILNRIIAGDDAHSQVGRSGR
jgi:hypothetical protein